MNGKPDGEFAVIYEDGTVPDVDMFPELFTPEQRESILRQGRQASWATLMPSCAAGSEEPGRGPAGSRVT